jgi:hypothetical protein
MNAKAGGEQKRKALADVTGKPVLMVQQVWTPNKERELHSECGVCGREKRVLTGSPHDGGNGDAANVRAHPSK